MVVLPAIERECVILHVCFQVIFMNPVAITDRNIKECLMMVEEEMRCTLACLLAQAAQEIREIYSMTIDQQKFINWVDRYPDQLVTLAAQIIWSESAEKALQVIEQDPEREVAPMANVLNVIEAVLNVLADCVVHEQPQIRRKKVEHLVCTG